MGGGFVLHADGSYLKTGDLEIGGYALSRPARAASLAAAAQPAVPGADAIDFAGTRYTFAKPVVLTSKEQCKNGGWATSTKPVFANQGACVSSFARTK